MSRVILMSNSLLKRYFVLLSVLCWEASFAQDIPIKVACIGNSITAGYGLKNPGKESYPAILQELLGERYQVNNWGLSGATLLKKGHRPYYQTKEFSQALDSKPAIVILHLGLNDTDPRNWPNYKGDFEGDYAWLIDTFRKENPNVRLFISRMTPVFNEHPRFRSGTRDWYWQIQEKIPQIAKVNKVQLIDLNTPLHDRPDLFPDNVHPVKEGAAIIAKTVYQAITGDFGGLNLPQVFSDNMILQRNQPIPIYGTANAAQRVEVHFNNKKLFASADEIGNWKAVFPAMAHGGPYQLTVESEGKNISLKDILVGDVWLCSGQSNMAFPLINSESGSQEIKNSSISNLRLFKLNQISETNNAAWSSVTLAETNQLKFFSGSWKKADSETAANFSAVAWYFGKEIAGRENIPIGLIEIAVGGSPIESWIDRYTLEHDEQLVDLMDNWRRSKFSSAWAQERIDINLKNSPSNKQRHPYGPAYNYEAGIAKLIHSPIKGVIWYQGESDAHHVELYENLFKTMVSSWRQKWNYVFPFYYVQLSSIDRPSWPYFREMQGKLQNQILKTGMAVSSDLGDSLNVHPVKKKEIGHRLALLALRDTYSRQVIASGPKAITAVQKQNQIIVSFTGAKKLSTGDQQILNGFELVTEKGLRIASNGIIIQNKIFLGIPEGERIKTVLYAFQPFTRANLVNEAGLPASTFSLPVTY